MCCGAQVELPNLAGSSGSVITTVHDRTKTPHDLFYALFAGFGYCKKCDTARQWVGNSILECSYLVRCINGIAKLHLRHSRWRSE